MKNETLSLGVFRPPRTMQERGAGPWTLALMLAVLAALPGPCDSFIALCPRGAVPRLLAARGAAALAPGTEPRCAAMPTRLRQTREGAAASMCMRAGTWSSTCNPTRQTETASASADRLRATRCAAALRHHQRVRHCALNPSTLQSFTSTAAAHNSNSVAAWRSSRRTARSGSREEERG